MNKLFAIILTLFLSLPVSVWAVDTTSEERVALFDLVDKAVKVAKDNEYAYKVNKKTLNRIIPIESFLLFVILVHYLLFNCIK